MVNLKLLVLLFFLICFRGVKANDTLFIHPNYPAIVLNKAAYNYYVYTPKYIPSSLFHAFEILATSKPKSLTRFMNYETDEVIYNGIYTKDSRIRKEFGLEGYSTFSKYFHAIGIYDPFVMESYILLGFHQYLNGQKIRWNQNKRIALKYHKKNNREWKRQQKKLFRRGRIILKESKKVSKKEEAVAEATPWFKY